MAEVAVMAVAEVVVLAAAAAVRMLLSSMRTDSCTGYSSCIDRLIHTSGLNARQWPCRTAESLSAGPCNPRCPKLCTQTARNSW